MRSQIQLTDQIRSILQSSTITENSVKLPEQLDRETYLAVDKILKTAGGKWNRKEKSHIFGSDPRQVLGLAIEQGTITDVKKETQAYYTPEAVATQAVEAALEFLDKPLSACRVLEPSAGQGALAKAILAKAKPELLVLCELDKTNEPELRKLSDTVIVGDFLTSDVGNQFDLIVMNPPFTGNQYIDHIQRAVALLRNNGVLTVTVPSSFSSTSSIKKVKDAFQLFMKFNPCLVTSNPEGAFKESGTNVSTLQVTIKKSL